MVWGCLASNLTLGPAPATSAARGTPEIMPSIRSHLGKPTAGVVLFLPSQLFEEIDEDLHKLDDKGTTVPPIPWQKENLDWVGVAPIA